MTNRYQFMNYCLFASLLGVFGIQQVDAAKFQNRSKADSYNQVYMQQQQADYYQQQSTNSLPINVPDQNLAQNILNNTDSRTSLADLEQCKLIYPNGEFEWATPTMNVTSNSLAQCVAVVELRALNAAKTGGDLVLARSKVPVGSAFKCNVSVFPEADLTDAAGEFLFPADNPPTLEEVEQVMNQEQKQNAGMKIVAAAVLGGIAGNMTGKNAAGKDSLLGTSKDKLKNTAIAAVASGGVMAASTYSGKVAGDIILSTGVNAASGAVIGNMTAGQTTSDSILRIEQCSLPDKTVVPCLWGNVYTEVKDCDNDNKFCKGSEDPNTWMAFWQQGSGRVTLCKQTDTEGTVKFEACESSISADNIILSDCTVNTSDKSFSACLKRSTPEQYVLQEKNMKRDVTATENIYFQVKSFQLTGKSVPAAVQFNEKETAFGLKKEVWTKWVQQNPNAKIYRRYGGQEASELEDLGNEYTVSNSKVRFEPLYRSGNSEDVIDLDNKTRTKGTLIGAGIGGAMGGYSAYQGAQDEISNRWATATTEYKNSLSKVICVTGTRYLSSYNDTVILPSTNGN